MNVMTLKFILEVSRLKPDDWLKHLDQFLLSGCFKSVVERGLIVNSKIHVAVSLGCSSNVIKQLLYIKRAFSRLCTCASSPGKFILISTDLQLLRSAIVCALLLFSVL